MKLPKGSGTWIWITAIMVAGVVVFRPPSKAHAAQTQAYRAPRTADGAEAPKENQIFAEGMRGPFGISFYPPGDQPQWIYVANVNSVVRIPYRNGDLKASGEPQVIVPKLADTTGGHTTRTPAMTAVGMVCRQFMGTPSNDPLLGKGAALGTVLAFMMSVIGLSLPEMIILRKVLKVPLILTFAGVVALGILVVGYVFNLVL